MDFLVHLFQSYDFIYAQGILSSQNIEIALGPTPDESIAYVARHDGNWGSRDNPPAIVGNT